MPVRRSRDRKPAADRARRSRASRPAAAKKRPKLTYRVGTAMARLTRNLIDGRRIGWDELAADLAGGASVSEIDEREIRSKEKTAKRYLAALREEVFVGGHVPLLRLLDRTGHDIEPGANGKVPFNRIREAELVRTRDGDDEGDDSPVADVLPQYLAFAILQLLESVLPKEEIRELWERQVGRQIALGQNPALRNFQRKFLAIPFGEKIYNRNSEDRRTLDAIVHAILNDRLLRIVYRKPDGPREHDLEPWSLATYKSGLYVIGRPTDERTPRVFAIDRLESVDEVRSDDGTPVGFAYPAEKAYDPAAMFRDAFGIFIDPEGKKVRIRLRIHSALIAERIEERSFHPTQKITRRPDGDWELTMTVVAPTEVEPWVLSWGAHVTLLEPEDMRQRLEKTFRDALARYGPAAG